MTTYATIDEAREARLRALEAGDVDAAIAADDALSTLKEQAGRQETPPVPLTPASIPAADTPEGRIAAERFAQARADQRAGLAELARGALERRGARREELTNLPDDDLIRLAGFAAEEREEPIDAESRERTRQLEGLEHQWWSLAPLDRKKEAERLGLDFETADKQMRAVWAQRVNQW